MKTGENKKALGEKGLKLGRVAVMAALLSTSAFIPLSHANPEGGQIVGGSATISESGKKLDVHQHTDRTVIDWRSFNIDVDEHTEFHQPSSSATALNRVKSTDPSQILGKLTANGNIVLVNPNGVFFGRDSVVDVNGLVATTADIDTDAFMGGSNHFNIPGNPDAAIVNEGTITAKEAGLVGLVAPNVENHGIIKAKMGRVQLASGDTVVADFYGDGLLKVEVTDENVKSQFVGNTGKLEAEGGTVAMTAAAARQTVNSLIVAKGELKAPTISKHGGKIVIAAASPSASPAKAGASGSTETDPRFRGESTILVQASLDASGRDAGEQGGSIEVLGDHIALLDGTVMDASGHSSLRANDLSAEALAKAEESAAIQSTDGGTATMTADKQVRSEEDFMADERRAGGSIKIGGDYLGQGETQTAKTLYVGANTLTLNNAIDNGDAGRTIFWSDDTTEFNGLVLAMGGTNGGNGGFLETSGKVNLLANGFADLSVQYIPSPLGGEGQGEGGINPYQKGTYLLDPQTITIYGNVDPKFVSTDSSINLATPLQLWLDGNDIDGDGVAEGLGETGLVSGAGNCGSAITCVASWTDKSGKGNNATQGTAANRPQFVVGGQNGLDILDFSLASYLLATPNNAIKTATSLSTFLVSEKGSLAQANWQIPFSLWFQPTSNSNSPKIHLSFSENADNTPTLFYNASNKYKYPTSFTGSGFQILNYIAGSTGTGISLNGAYQSNSTPVSLVNNPASNALIVLGDARNNSVAGFTGSTSEVILYSTPVSDNERNLIEQYQSAKWGIALDKLAGAGTEIAEATAHDAGNPTNAATNGYNVFTTRYLERLAGSADLMLQASTGITLDLKGDTLDLTGGAAAGKSITLQTDNGDITDASSGTIRTTKTGSGAGLNGNISLIAGGAGNINLDTTNLDAQNGGQVSLTAGGSVSLTQTSALNLGSVSGQNVSIRTTGGTSDVTLNNTITATASGNALTVASGRNFINNAGAGALNTTDINGRWLVYSADPGANTLGGLTSDFKRYNKTYAGYAPGSVVETGDGLLYSIAPTLNITANNQSRNFGFSNPSLTYTTSGLIDGDTLTDALGALPTLTTSAGQNSVAGTYPITGTFSSALGYTVNFTPGTLTVNPQTSLPASFEGVAYANEGLNLNQSLISQNTGFNPSVSGSPAPTQINFTIAQNDSDAGSKSGQNIQTTGMNVTIEASLARTLGLTQEKINAMFR